MHIKEDLRGDKSFLRGKTVAVRKWFDLKEKKIVHAVKLVEWWTRFASSSINQPQFTQLPPIDLHCGKHYYNEQTPVLHNNLSRLTVFKCARVTAAPGDLVEKQK